jgi:hypothetical protein
MFLCDPCHKKSRCDMYDFDSLFGPFSHGPCEVCGKRSVCVDCRRYGRAEAPVDETKGGGE